jgi:hypothetical protein
MEMYLYPGSTMRPVGCGYKDAPRLAANRDELRLWFPMQPDHWNELPFPTDWPILFQVVFAASRFTIQNLSSSETRDVEW